MINTHTKQKHIKEFKEYTAVADPLRNLQKEIKEANDRLDQIGIELSRYAVKSDSPGAWNTYLNEGQDGAEQRDALKAEANKLGDRKRLLEKALNEGRQEVDRVCGQLSREPCKQARPRNVEQIRRILKAQQEIADACAELGKIREEL